MAGTFAIEYVCKLIGIASKHRKAVHGAESQGMSGKTHQSREAESSVRRPIPVISFMKNNLLQI
jgi:hypothetical protein